MTNDNQVLDIRNCALGTTFTPDQLKQQTHIRYGGVAWPGTRPGFAVVLAVGKQRHFDGYDLYLLDEIESSDIRELVHRCDALNAKYTPGRWMGDNRNSTADRFIHELNASRQPPPPNPFEDVPECRLFYVCGSPLLNMERPYQYMLPTLKNLLREDRRQLFLKDSRIRPYLVGIEPGEIPFMEFSEYPAIEALTFAVHEIMRWQPPDPNRRHWHRSIIRM